MTAPTAPGTATTTTTDDQDARHGVNVEASRIARSLSPTILLLVAAAIAASEVARLISETLSSAGQSYSIDDVLGPLALTNVGAWTAWTTSKSDPVAFLVAHTVILVFVYLSSAAIARLLTRESRPALQLIRTLLAVEALELVATLVASILVGTHLSPVAAGWTVAVLATAKWVIAVLIAIAGLRNRDVVRRVRDGIVRSARALFAQRLSLVVLLFFAATSLLPRSGILEQLPDAQRAWLDKGGDGVVEALIAIAALFIAALALFVLGRQRARRYWLTNAALQPPSSTSAYLWWFSAPIVTVATWLILLAFGRGDLVDFPQFPAFVIAVSALPLISLALRVIQRRRGKTIWSPTVPTAPRFRNAQDVWTAGDILAGLVASIAGLGLVRAFVAPALLGLLPGSGISPLVTTLSWIAWVGGAVFGTLILAITGAFATRFDRTLSRSTDGKPLRGLWPVLDPSVPGPIVSRRLVLLAAGFFIAAVLTIAAMMVFPRPISSTLGIVGSVAIILAAWSIVIGTVTIRLQYRQPLELFRMFHLRSDPVLVMLIVIPALLSQLGGAANLHAIERDSAAPANPVRPSLSQAFQSWLDRTSSCDQPIPGSTATVRPLVIAASEGGGIRAATWTVDVFDKLKTGGDCAKSDVLLSSGVSGGSVGLALFHGTGNTAQPSTEIKRVSDADALGAAVTGALVGDTLAATTGLRIPSLDDRNGKEAWTWQDRAGLMQSVWRDEAPQLASPFDAQSSDPTGLLIMNSTASGYGCRILVSQIDLRAGDHSSSGVDSSGTAEAPDCRSTSVELPDSLDLEDLYGSCPLQMDWSTAALLSARFPIVSPAGRVSNNANGTSSAACASLPDLQLIDGGYSESTGLGTLSDLSPALATIVRNHNAKVGSNGSYVVPIVMYLQNSSGADVTARPPRVNAELAVPLVGVAASKLQIDPGTWLQRMSQTLGSVCVGGDSTCQAAVAQLRSTAPGGVIVVAPTTRASIAAPLGWALSDFSRANLSGQVDVGACQTSAAHRYGRLADLLTLLQDTNAC